MWDTIIINPMTNLLLWIYDVLGHGPHMFGLAIILFTILIKVITWPLNASQVKGAQVASLLYEPSDRLATFTSWYLITRRAIEQTDTPAAQP